MNKTDQACLLSFMESGLLSELNIGNKERLS